jgi:diguanylate cyclase (GGDEF)-like protein
MMNERSPVSARPPANELTDESSAHLQRVRERFVENMWNGVFVVVLFGTPISVLRAVNTGWLTTYSIHVAIALASLIVFILRNRLSLRLKSTLLMAFFWAVGLPGVFTMGFPATSVWWLVLSCLVAGTVFPIRVGIAFGVATLAVVAIAAFGFITGRLSLAYDPNTYLRQPSTWLVLFAVTGAFTFIVLRSTWLYSSSLVELLRQVSDQRDQIEKLAAHDQLTGLPLAQRAEDRISLTFDAALRSGRKVALMFIDLDDFKAVNDTFGHEAGDFVLREVAQRIKASIRATDTVARIGGDELLAIIGELKGTSPAAAVAGKIILAASVPIEFNGHLITVGASVGIAIYPDDGSDLPTLRGLADAAMYAAKKTGRNHYAFASARVVSVAGEGDT